MRLLLLLLATIVAQAHGWKCSTCKEIISKFTEGLKVTAKSNFGGGNTDWEEKSLGSFEFSETRLIEILEHVCILDDECHTFIEHYEEDIEDWWFKHYAKRKDTSLHKYLCIDKSAACCEDGTFGPVCLPCKGGKEQPCRGKGTCNGDGTREGTGKCSCHAGYTGEECENCKATYYEESRNETHTVCAACHQSCKEGCEGPESKQCYDCAEGWELDEDGCLDIDECAKEESPCKENEFCTNNEGSYTCTACHRSCAGCEGAGADRCEVCAARYYKDLDDKKCKECHMSCESACVDGTPESCDACKEGWTMGDTGCQDVNECEDETAECDNADSYCTNTPGSYRCSTCHPNCNGCTGAGSMKCKECKEGYKQDEQGSCQDIDECTESEVCIGEQEKCTNTQGSYRCTCNDGYVRKDDKCVQKQKEKPKVEKKKSKAYKGPANCNTCKDIVRNIHAGMEKTENTNFGGGNTRWEEQKLGKYIYSETRLIEILERVCGLFPEDERPKKEQDEELEACYDMLEKYEETLEEWWFKFYAKGETVDLEEWLCVNKMMICCPEGTYGPECKPCIGGRERPCYGNGKCDGDGTRKGTGVCKCDKGYKGYECSECAPLNYTSHHNDTHIECKGCHSACMTACFDEGAAGCEDCNSGWRFETDQGCVDVNECDAESSPCDDDQYCENEEGAFKCHECDEACNESCIGPGPGNCKACNELYYRDEQEVCKPCHKSCARSCTDGSSRTCDACRAGWVAVEGEEGGCEDVDECSSGEVTCPEGQYCQNTEGSHKCTQCASACQQCTGAGPAACVGPCARGFKRASDDPSEACQDINECSEEGKAAECAAAGKVCANTTPGYKCQCPAGQQEDKDGKCVPKKEKPKKKKDGKKKKDKKKSGRKDSVKDEL